MIEIENLSKRYGEKVAVDPFSSCLANSKLTRRGSPAHRGLGRAVVMQSFDAGPPHIASTGMRGVVGGQG